MKKTDKIRSIVAYIILYIGLFLLSAIGAYMFHYYHEAKVSNDNLDSVRDLIHDYDDSKLQELYANGGKELQLRPRDYSDVFEANEDCIGWIKIEDTPIDFPVMWKPSDQDYYLHRNFQKQYDYSGVPYCNAEADPIRPAENTIIYGHHMRSGAIFASLDGYKQKSYYEEHPIIIFDTRYRWAKYEVVAVVLTDANPGCFTYWGYSECNEDDFNDYVEWFTKKALYDTELLGTVEYGDKLITLSTCAYHVTNGRELVIAKMIEEETTPLYNELDIEEMYKDYVIPKVYNKYEVHEEDETNN